MAHSISKSLVAALPVVLLGVALRAAPAAAQGPNWIVDAMYASTQQQPAQQTQAFAKASTKVAAPAAGAPARLNGTNYFGSMAYSVVVPQPGCADSASSGFIVGLGDQTDDWWDFNSIYTILQPTVSPTTGLWMYTLFLETCYVPAPGPYSVCPGGTDNNFTVSAGDTITATVGQTLRTDGSGGVTVTLNVQTTTSGSMNLTYAYPAPVPLSAAYVIAFPKDEFGSECPCDMTWSFTPVSVTDLQTQQLVPPSFVGGTPDPTCPYTNDVDNSGPNDSATVTIGFDATPPSA